MSWLSSPTLTLNRLFVDSELRVFSTVQMSYAWTVVSAGLLLESNVKKYVKACESVLPWEDLLYMHPTRSLLLTPCLPLAAESWSTLAVQMASSLGRQWEPCNMLGFQIRCAAFKVPTVSEWTWTTFCFISSKLWVFIYRIGKSIPTYP